MPTLFMLHCPVNTGYAIQQHEGVFFDAGCQIERSADHVHFSYQQLGNQRPKTLPRDFTNVFEYDFANDPPEQRKELARYVETHGVSRVLAFDLEPGRPTHGILRRAGVERIVSYWGAPMGDPTRGFMLFLRRVQIALQSKADHYVFQSEAMRRTALYGRAIRPERTSIVRSGLDTSHFHPEAGRKEDLHERLGIPPDRLVLFYSGHMEWRKGVWVLINAAKHLVDRLGCEDVHVLVCGNKEGEEAPYLDMLQGSRAADFVTFGGYREDMQQLAAAADIGVIATSGWDSFPRSSMEMPASGLPLIVSNIGGLPEAVVHGETGFVFPSEDHETLARYILQLRDDPLLRRTMSQAGRSMAVERYQRSRQVDQIADVLRRGS